MLSIAMQLLTFIRALRPDIMMAVCAASIFSTRLLSPFASFSARLYDRCTASELAPGDRPST